MVAGAMGLANHLNAATDKVGVGLDGSDILFPEFAILS